MAQLHTIGRIEREQGVECGLAEGVIEFIRQLAEPARRRRCRQIKALIADRRADARQRDRRDAPPSPRRPACSALQHWRGRCTNPGPSGPLGTSRNLPRQPMRVLRCRGPGEAPPIVPRCPARRCPDRPGHSPTSASPQRLAARELRPRRVRPLDRSKQRQSPDGTAEYHSCRSKYNDKGRISYRVQAGLDRYI